jgi:cytochrome c-type biogenesis protein CcmH
MISQTYFPMAALLAAVAALVPLAWSIWRPLTIQGRRQSAMALHRAQLDEIDRDASEGRIPPELRETARLEVQRRLLAAAESPDVPPATGGRALVIAALIMVPLASVSMYSIGGHPELPGAPLAARIESGEVGALADAQIARALRARIEESIPGSDETRQGYVLLGNVENAHGNLAEAADAWGAALAIQFDPTLAAQTAEARTQADGRMTPVTAGLFRQALAAAPIDAPWRSLAERRLVNFGETGKLNGVTRTGG